MTNFKDLKIEIEADIKVIDKSELKENDTVIDVSKFGVELEENQAVILIVNTVKK